MHICQGEMLQHVEVGFLDKGWFQNACIDPQPDYVPSTTSREWMWFLGKHSYRGWKLGIQ